MSKSIHTSYPDATGPYAELIDTQAKAALDAIDRIAENGANPAAAYVYGAMLEMFLRKHVTQGGYPETKAEFTHVRTALDALERDIQVELVEEGHA